MNKILIGINALLIIAVAFLFYKTNGSAEVSDSPKTEKVEKPVAEEPAKPTQQVATAPTGKFAYINIDRLNEESLEISDLVTETKRRKNNIEANMEHLSLQYEKKVQEFQMSQKAGIASQADLEAKAREIQSLEQEAQNKQIQMDNLSMDINEKNVNFQKRVKDFLLKWNDGRYDFILSYSDAVPSMLLGNKSLEVTDEVIKQINDEYKARKGRK